MSRNLSEAAFRAMFAQQTSEAFLICLTLQHPTWDEPFRVVQNNQDITRASGVFHKAFFEVNLPEEAPDRVPNVQISFDNVDRSIVDRIRSISGRVSVTIEVILASSPNVVEAGPLVFALLNVTYNAQSVSGTLSFEDDVLNCEFPQHRYTPGNSPGLFK